MKVDYESRRRFCFWTDRRDNFLPSRKGVVMKNNHFTEEKRVAFHELMVNVQSASNGTLPLSIVHFMEEALEPDTKSALLQMYAIKCEW